MHLDVLDVLDQIFCGCKIYLDGFNYDVLKKLKESLFLVQLAAHFFHAESTFLYVPYDLVPLLMRRASTVAGKLNVRKASVLHIHLLGPAWIKRAFGSGICEGWRKFFTFFLL